MKKRSLIWVVFYCILAVPAYGIAQENNSGMTPAHVLSMEYVTSTAISPDGKYAAYTKSVPRTEEEDPGSRHAELYVVNLKTKGSRLYVGKATRTSSISFSPDGRLTFKALRKDQDPHTQVWTMSLTGGEAELLTHHETSVGSYAWSPDGRYLAYTASDADSKEEEADKKAGRDWKVVDSPVYHNTRLYVLDTETGDTETVNTGEVFVRSFVWKPDNSGFAIQATDGPTTDESYMHRTIYTVPRSGGEISQLTETEGKLGGMAFSPDGKNFAWLGGVDLYDPTSGSVFVVSASGGTRRNLTEGFEGTGFWVSWADNNNVLVAATEWEQTTVSQIDIRKGTIKKSVSKGPVFRGLSLSRDRKRFVTVGSTPSHPGEVFLGTVRGKKLTRVTFHNPEFDDIQFGKQEQIRWKARDGWTIGGLIIKPLGFTEGEAYPTVVQVHGGPESAYVNGWNTYYSRWSQLLAAKGYLVFIPNYRASTGRGVEYSKADHKDLAGKEFDDILDGLDYLAEQGMTDPDRVGMGGGSYGGYFSGWAATKHTDRFKAVVDFAGISNWISFLGTSDIPEENSLVHWNLWCYDDVDLCWDRSPIAHANGSKTATLILHGEKDARVPISQGEELYQALKYAGANVEFVRYPGEPHGLLRRAHRADSMQRSLDWFDEHLK